MPAAADWLAGLLVLALLLAGAVWWQRAAAEGRPSSGGAPGEPVIIDRPIPFGEKRRALSLEYIRERYDPRAESIVIEPRMIVVHWTGSSSLLSTLAAFHFEALPVWRREIRRGGKVNVSAHFLIDRDGTLYRLMPETWMARHVIGLNHLAIGIENVGGPGHPLTEAQLKANAALVRHLAGKYPAVNYLIGHHEYGRFRGTPLWRERDAGYYTAKQDPGDAFMARLRAELADLGLAADYR